MLQYKKLQKPKSSMVLKPYLSNVKAKDSKPAIVGMIQCKKKVKNAPNFDTLLSRKTLLGFDWERYRFQANGGFRPKRVSLNICLVI